MDELMRQVQAKITSIEDLDEKVAYINELRRAISDVSPFTDPIDLVEWVPVDQVEANAYNPNRVAPPEMKLLYLSMKEDGVTQPVVTYYMENGKKEIVDGFHRREIIKYKRDIRKSCLGYAPVTRIKKSQDERMASTIRHNRARGEHDVDLMSNIVAELHELGRSDAWIAKHLGMDLDEILRLKQITGLASLFADEDFSSSWEAEKE